MTQKKSILVIDDHPLFREGIKRIIENTSKYELVGEAGTGRQGLQMAKKLKPDLVLVDMSLPDQSGIELTRDILNFSSEIRILIVSMHSKVDYIVKAFQAGATGYLVKESAADMLLEGIDCVLKGDYYMDTKVSQKVVKKLVGIPKHETMVAADSYDSLTPREQEIMALLAEGRSTSQIADKLFISPKTAENHRSSIMRKLDIHSTIELVRYAAKIGLIDMDLWIK
ncbi:MAG TPA: response regulator transcription factor [Desulfobacterales bacterium]|nr:response regulator transcription factor [Desulfobacterales bacterium]